MRCSSCREWKRLNKFEGVCNYLSEYNNSAVYVAKEFVCAGYKSYTKFKRKQRGKRNG